MRYDIVYADPPWRYKHSRSRSRKIENQYPTMSLVEIKALRVPSKPNAVLYMWATAPKLLEALAVMEAWGFNYRTHAVWDKEIIGMGYWWRGQHELLLVGTRGKFSPPPCSLRVSSVIKQRRGKHSVKPDIVRQLIEQWYPEAVRLEMFAREKRLGWDVWGDEVDGDAEIHPEQEDVGKSTLNKEVCIRCWKRDRLPWTDSHEKFWSEGKAWCPLRTLSGSVVSSKGSGPFPLADSPPEWCPYAAEHVVSTHQEP